MPIPLWLILFIAAGFLLFFFKISGERPTHSDNPKSSYLRLFLLIAFLLFTVAGIAAFVKWVNSPS